MADTSRKRSRKSKLVPRECAVDEDDLELQIPEAKVLKITKQTTYRPPAKKAMVKSPEPIIPKREVCNTSVLKKINASAKEDTEPETKISPRKFEINIEVESCDDDDKFSGVADENHLESLITTRVRTEPIELSREIIIDAADNILQNSTDVADKILNIYVRNTIGYEGKRKLVQDERERRIQQALDEWRTWQFRSFHREDPLFYKCYICTRSWWHLTDFRNHLSSEHADDLKVLIALEKYEMHEANLIAYLKYNWVADIKDIYTEGLCYRCGKDYGAHELGSRFQEKFYKNRGCTKQFFSCMGLRDHFSSCFVCKNQDKPNKCDICKSRFNTQEELYDHLVLSHSVRSDIPIMAHYKNCKRCSERYSCQYLHKCGQKEPHSECPHCLQSFSNVMSLEIHIERSSKPYKCEVCRAVMTYSCKKYEHMLAHTDKYMIVRKCVACEGLNVFINNEDAIEHRLLKHEFRETKRQSYFPKILVPSSCVYQSLAESESKEPESVLGEQESVLEENESVLEEQESLPEEEESLPEEEESLPDEAKYVPKEELVSKSERESVSVCEQKLLQAELESATEFLLGSVVVKEEPEDSEGSPRLIIKEEPFEEFENQMHETNRTENFEHEVSVKEEYIEEESDEYEGDIIKLNFNIEDLLVKQESIQEDDVYTLEQTEENRDSEDDNDSEEFPQQLKDSMLEPEVIIEGDYRKNQKVYRCTKCGFTAKHKQYRNHIDYDCGTNPVKHKTYTCTKCQNKFVSMKKYLTHFKEHGYKHLSCPDCLKEFDTFTNLGQHLTQHVKQNFVRVKMITHAGKAMTKPDYQCKKCGQIIVYYKFFEHWELHINAQPTHPIKVTSRPKHKDGELHGELHETIIKECIARLNKQPKECNHCHRWFKRVNECKRHIIEHLLSDAYNQKHIYSELKCQVCEQGFATPERYKQHMRDHASLPVYKCELCDRTFSDSSNFTKHKKVHNLKVIVCDLCGKKFQSKVSLEKHIEKHKNTEPITCKICNKIFYFDTSYRRHIRYFHEKTVIGYRCVICSERFDSLKRKWDHMWDVHKERKQKADCPICHQSFRKYSDVRVHARLHHLTEVSVLNLKKNAKNPNLDIDKFLRDSAKIKVGRMETLVVYDSD